MRLRLATPSFSGLQAIDQNRLEVWVATCFSVLTTAIGQLPRRRPFLSPPACLSPERMQTFTSDLSSPAIISSRVRPAGGSGNGAQAFLTSAAKWLMTMWLLGVGAYMAGGAIELSKLT